MSISTTRGSFIATRTSSASNAVYLNGNTTPIATGAIASTALVPAPIAVLASGNLVSGTVSYNNNSPDQAAAAFIGGGLTATQQQQVSNRINTYMTTFGINAY